MIKKIILFLFMTAITAAVSVGCGSGDSTPLDGATLVQQRCARCHTLERVEQEYERDRWPGIVTEMIQRSPGLLNEEEYDIVVEYLQENYGI